jgi:beta-phosphoglucomutase-like phosphatase (HAD superfamily)
VNSPEFAGLFKVAVSADEVGRGKPSPDVYLETAHRLGVAPEACVCLEDSGHGIDAGKAARMRVIAVPDPRFMPSSGTLSKADIVTSSLSDVTLAMLSGDA